MLQACKAKFTKINELQNSYTKLSVEHHGYDTFVQMTQKKMKIEALYRSFVAKNVQ